MAKKPMRKPPMRRPMPAPEGSPADMAQDQAGAAAAGMGMDQYEASPMDEDAGAMGAPPPPKKGGKKPPRPLGRPSPKQAATAMMLRRALAAKAGG